MNTSLFWILLSIIVPIVLWLINPMDFKRLVKNFFKNIFSGEIKVDSIIDLENKGLIIENKELLMDKNLVKKNNYIFWPVVPTDSPNIIHAIFINYLNYLSKDGLRIIVFVFDYYYRLIKQKNNKLCDEEVSQFVNGLYKLGLKNCNHNIVYESKIFAKSSTNRIILEKLLNYFSNIDIGSIEKIGKQKGYMKNSTKLIRYIKPCLNMLYLNAIKKKFGFTLSGYDEKPLWDTFKKYIPEGKNIRLTNLYIPKMHSITGRDTDVLDKIDNITLNDSISDIRNKLIKLDYINIPNSTINYLLEKNLFLFDKEITIKLQDEKSTKRYNSLKEIKDDLKNNIISKESVDESIVRFINSILHKDNILYQNEDVNYEVI